MYSTVAFKGYIWAIAIFVYVFRKLHTFQVVKLNSPPYFEILI
jgi:hypothetical protein